MAAPLRNLAAFWRQRLLEQDRRLRQDLTRQWLGMESALDADMAAYAYAPEEEREVRGQALTRKAQTQLRQIVSLAGAAILAAGTQYASLGQRAGQEFLREQGLAPRAGYVPRGWDNGWESSLRKTEALALSGLIAAMMLDGGTTESLRALQNGLAQGFAQVTMIARDYPMGEFRAQLGAYEAPGGWLRVSARAPTTCMACILLDGTVYERLEEFSDHPHGLCFPVPLAAGQSIGESGLEWFMGLSAQEQKSRMGPEYYAAWKAGQFNLLDLILVVGAGYAVVKSLKKLTDGGK